MKRLLGLLVTLALLATMLVLPQTALAEEEQSEGGYKIGYVTLATGSEFFQMLADAYKETFEAAGWEANYADGQFSPEAQINACENYIAQGVDVLLLWSVAPEAMDSIVAQCKEKGIKLIAFVQPTSEYDVCMVADEIVLADYTEKLAIDWVEKTFPDAEPGSVPAAMITYTQTDTAKAQTERFKEIEQSCDKIKLETVVELEEDTIDMGYKAAENLVVTNPDVKLIITPSNNIADGVNQYLTSMASPITDYSDMGIFCCNGNTAMGEAIKASVNNEAPLRGMVLTGGIQDTANEMLEYATAIMEGTIEPGSTITADIIFVYGDTVDEYLETGTVKSVTKEDFDK